MRILIVDDDANTRRALDKLLRQEGHETFLAADGGEALRAIYTTEQPFELMLLDLSMPRFDGWDLIRLKRMSPELDNCPIIVITGATDDEMRTHGRLDGVALVFSKPLHFDQLIKTIEHFERPTTPPPRP